MSEKKRVLLATAVTYKGVDYAPGLNEMPEEAADLAVQKKFGVFEKSNSGGNDFQPLSFEETQRRFFDGDEAEEVFNSLRFYQSKMKFAKEAGISLEEYLEKEAADQSAGNQSNSEKTDKSEDLPKDFPGRRVFEKLGENFDSVEKVQAMSEADLIALDGIAEATAKSVLAYKRDGK